MKMKRVVKTNPKVCFDKFIFPLYAKDFLLGSNYENFAKLVSEDFILTSDQWEYILKEWELKEKILSF